MPTYTYRCEHCGEEMDCVLSISQYIRTRPYFVHCGHEMQRKLSVVPMAAMSCVFNDRHYEGLRAQDGTDISSRAKHQAYMKAKGLTTVDDFKETWAKAHRERKEMQAGHDPTRRQDIEKAIHKLGS